MSNKRSCPWANDAPGASGDMSGSVCPLVARVPKAGRTGDMIRDQEKNTMRSAYVNVLELLWQHPKLILQTQGFVQETLRKTADAPKSADEFDELTSIAALAKSDAAWLAHWVSKQTKISCEVLQKCVSYDDCSLLHIFLLLTNMSTSMKLPAECKNKRVLTCVLDKRVEELQSRGKYFDNEGDFFVNRDGSIRWPQVGCYRIKWSDKGVATEMTYWPTQETVAIPETITITPAYMMTANWCPASAMVALGPGKYKCADFFKKKTGPWKESLWTGRSEGFKATVVAAVMVTEARRAEEGVGDSQFVTLVKQRDQEAVKRARTALEQRRQDVQNKRKVALNITVPQAAE